MITPRFMTIRQTAATGILPERRLRALQKEGRLPGIQSGKKFLIKYPLLLEVLDSMSRVGVKLDA